MPWKSKISARMFKHLQKYIQENKDPVNRHKILMEWWKSESNMIIGELDWIINDLEDNARKSELIGLAQLIEKNPNIDNENLEVKKIMSYIVMLINEIGEDDEQLFKEDLKRIKQDRENRA